MNEDGIGFDLLNEALGTLSKHGGHVGGTYKEDLFAVEALGEVDKGSLEAVDSVR